MGNPTITNVEFEHEKASQLEGTEDFTESQVIISCRNYNPNNPNSETPLGSYFSNRRFSFRIHDLRNLLYIAQLFLDRPLSPNLTRYYRAEYSRLTVGQIYGITKQASLQDLLYILSRLERSVSNQEKVKIQRLMNSIKRLQTAAEEENYHR